MIAIATSLSDVSRSYRVLFVDVWGVIHNGVAPIKGASTALRSARDRGQVVVLISNAPRLSSEIPHQFARIGVPSDIYDAIVTSGDATREIIRSWSAKDKLRLYHIGPDRDLSVFEGLDVERVSLDVATHVVCTGLRDDETERPEDYDEVLRAIVARGLPFLCANPDIVVQRGDKLVYCAGALARRLEAFGGSAIYPGKPHVPIYELAMTQASVALGRPAKKSDVLAIGDGLATDILGAQRFGVAALFMAEGIHTGDFRSAGALDPTAVEAACEKVGVRPIAVMAALAP